MQVPSGHASEISSRYVRASEPPLSRGGSVGTINKQILAWNRIGHKEYCHAQEMEYK